jgi:hypothetical protein
MKTVNIACISFSAPCTCFVVQVSFVLKNLSVPSAGDQIFSEDFPSPFELIVIHACSSACDGIPVEI